MVVKISVSYFIFKIIHLKPNCRVEKKRLTQRR